MRDIYRVWQKSSHLRFFCSYLSNHLELRSEILPTYLVIHYTHNSIIVIQLA